MSQPPSSPRFVIDCSTYTVNNNGDIAMFSMLFRRLRGRYPHARISVITNDAANLRQIDPAIEPILVGDRRFWSLEPYFSTDLATRFQYDQYLLENAIRRLAPERYWALVAGSHPTAAQHGRRWQKAVRSADALFLTGGGYFTDAFAEHATYLLNTLDEGLVHHKPAFIVGCGFEPISDPKLTAMANALLPQLSFICCREDTTSPTILQRHGVAPEDFAVTGDDTVELAYEARSDQRGTHIGVNIRNAVYNAVDSAQMERLRGVLHQAAREYDVSLIPLPISNFAPADAAEIQKLLRPEDGFPDGGAALDTPQKLFPQMHRCRIIVTGSYHAAVFGLAMGIPVIALTQSSHYQYKMSGLLALFFPRESAEKLVLSLGDSELVTKLSSAIRHVWDIADASRQSLLNAAERQMQASRRAYNLIFDKIDVSLRHKTPRPPYEPPTLTLKLAQATISTVAELTKMLAQVKSERDYFEEHATARLKIIEQLNAHNKAVEAAANDRYLLGKSLEEKESFIQELSKAAAVYRSAFLILGYVIRPVNRMVSAARFVTHWSRNILAPRLGNLNQHAPRELRLPTHYARPVHVTQPPKISIVTPSFKQARFIERTIKSVLDQSYPNLEYHVQDGGSEDGTREILERYADRLASWESRPDNGQSRAINLGFARTSGEIMAWLNSDDIMLPGALAYVAAYFNQHPDIDVVYGHRILIDKNDQQIGRWMLPAHDDAVLSWADYIPQETLFWRRRIWDKVDGKVDESFRFAMDWDLLVRFRAAGAKFHRLPRFLGAFRVHPHQKTSAAISDIGHQEMARIRARVLGHEVSNMEIGKAILPYLLRHFATDLGYRIRNKLRPP